MNTIMHYSLFFWDVACVLSLLTAVSAFSEDLLYRENTAFPDAVTVSFILLASFKKYIRDVYISLTMTSSGKSL